MSSYKKKKCISGDFNFPASELTWPMLEGVLLPKVAGHRVSAGHGVQAGLIRQQALQLCQLAVKYQLNQQVNLANRGAEILDLVWSCDHDLVT